MLDRKYWPDGPWMQEPDHVEFKHAGFSCILHRNPLGAWCGYVGVPREHPAFESHYGRVDVRVHGGLTYGRECQGAICHKVPDGEDDHLWWLGFDCLHLGDWAPENNWGIWKRMEEAGSPAADDPRPRHYRLPSQDERYRDINYVRAETEELAEQLRALQ